MSNLQWCKRFNTKVDAGDAIAVTRQHKAFLEHVAQKQSAGTAVVTFASLTDAHQEDAPKDTEDRCILCVILRQSGAQHGRLKADLQNNFTTGDNHCPKTRQHTLHLLDKHS